MNGAGEPSTALGLSEATGLEPGQTYAARLDTGDNASGQIWYQTHFQTAVTVEARRPLWAPRQGETFARLRAPSV